MKKLRTLITIFLVMSSTLVAASPTFEHISSIHLGSRYQKIVERDGYWYLAGEWGLECWQFNAQNEFVKLSEVATPGIAQWVALEGDYAYVADGWEGLTIVDVTNPLDLNFVSNFVPPFIGETQPGFYPFVSVLDDVVYLSGSGVIAINADDPLNPFQTARLAIPDTDGAYYNPTGMTLPEGSDLWVARSDAQFHGDTIFYGVYRYDIRNPSYPVYRGFYPVGSYRPAFLAYRDSVLFVSGNWGLWTYRLNCDTSLSPLDSLEDMIFHTGDPLDMALGANRVYLAGKGGSYLNGGIAVVDISDPRNISVLEDYRKPEMFNSVAISDRQVIAGYWQDGLLLMSAEGPEELDSTGYVGSAANVNSLAVYGEYLFVSDVFNGIHCFDITNPSAPIETDLLARTNPRCLDVWENNLLVGQDASPYLYIFDVSTVSPQLSDSLLIPNSTGLAVITHRDSMIFVGAGDLQYSNLHVIIESRGNYRHIMEIPANNLSDLAVSDQFIATPRSIYTIDNDTSISSIASFGSVWLDGIGVALSDSTIITAEQFGGMTIFRLRASKQVELITTWYPWPSYSGATLDVLVAGESTVVIASQELGIETVTLSDLSMPQHLAYSNTPGYANNLMIDLEHLYVGDIWDVEIYQHDIEVDVEALDSPLPREFSLHQNFPNPFNAATAIIYEIERSGKICLEIFSSSGQLVRTIASGDCAPGRYTVIWNGLNRQGREVASGVYFARLTANNRNQVIRLVLVR